MIPDDRLHIHTAPYSLRPSAIARRIALAWTGRWWWLLALPMIAALVASLHNWLWLAALCFLLLVAVPGILGMVYYYYALSPEAARDTIPHSVSLDSVGLTVDYLAQEGQWQPPSRNIGYDRVARAQLADASVILWLKGKGYHHVELPRAAFASNSDYDQTLEILTQKGLFGTNFADHSQ